MGIMTGWVDGWGLTKKNRILLEGLLEDVIFELRFKERSHLDNRGKENCSGPENKLLLLGEQTEGQCGWSTGSLGCGQKGHRRTHLMCCGRPLESSQRYSPRTVM